MSWKWCEADRKQIKAKQGVTFKQVSN